MPGRPCPSLAPTPVSPNPHIPLHSYPFSLAGSNRVFTEGTCKLLTLVVTDLVDEDLVLNHRKQAASALLFGMVALVTKPGQTFAPLLGTWLLCFYTGEGPGVGMVFEAPGAYLVYLLMNLGPGLNEAERMITSHDRGWAWAAPGCHLSSACSSVGRGAGFHLSVVHSFIQQICMGYFLC